MNTRDLVFCSYKSHVSSLTVNEPFSTSDHNSINFKLRGSYLKVALADKRDFSKGNYDQINYLLQSINWPSTFSDCININDFYERFLSILKDLIEKYIPFKKSRSRFKYPRNIRLLQSKKLHLWNKCRSNPELKERYRALNKATEKTIIEFHAANERKLLKKGSDI